MTDICDDCIGLIFECIINDLKPKLFLLNKNYTSVLYETILRTPCEYNVIKMLKSKSDPWLIKMLQKEHHRIQLMKYRHIGIHLQHFMGRNPTRFVVDLVCTIPSFQFSLYLECDLGYRYIEEPDYYDLLKNYLTDGQKTKILYYLYDRAIYDAVKRIMKDIGEYTAAMCIVLSRLLPKEPLIFLLTDKRVIEFVNEYLEYRRKYGY